MPAFFLDTGRRGFPVVTLSGLLPGLSAGAVVLTWMYEGAGASILIVAVWHLALSVGSATSAGAGPSASWCSSS